MAGRHYLDELLEGVRRIFADGAAVTHRTALNFVGLDVTDDSANERTVVSASALVARVDAAETAIDELELSVTPSATVAAITGAEAAGAATEYSRGDHAHRLGRVALTGSSGTMASLALDYEVDQSGSAVGYGLHIQGDESAIGGSHVPIRIAGSAGGEYFSIARASGVNTAALLGNAFTVDQDGAFAFLAGLSMNNNGEITTNFHFFEDGGAIIWNAASVFSLTQSQATSGAGAAATIRAQKGFAGSAGGALTIGGGLGGTSGSDLAGETRVDVGALVSSASAYFSVFADSAEILRVRRTASGNEITNSLTGSPGSILITAGSSFQLQGNNGIGVLQASADLYFTPLNGVYRWRGAASGTARVDTLAPVGANAQTWQQGITSLTDTIAAKTTDAVPAPRIIEGQSALAGASTNLIGGRLELASGARATAAGGAPGEIVRRFGGGREIREYAQDDITTTDDTTTTAISYTLGSGRCLKARASVVLRNAATGDVRAWTVEATVKDTAGTVSIVGTETVVHDQGDAGLSTAAIAFSASGGSLLLRVVGIAATNLSWRCVLEIVK